MTHSAISRFKALRVNSMECIPANTAAEKLGSASIFQQCSVKPFFCGTPRCPWGVFSGIIFLLPVQRTFVFTSPVAFYRFFQSIIVLIFTLNTAAVCVNEWLFCVYSIACSLKALSYDITCNEGFLFGFQGN